MISYFRLFFSSSQTGMSKEVGRTTLLIASTGFIDEHKWCTASECELWLEIDSIDNIYHYFRDKEKGEGENLPKFSGFIRLATFAVLAMFSAFVRLSFYTHFSVESHSSSSCLSSSSSFSSFPLIALFAGLPGLSWDSDIVLSVQLGDFVWFPIRRKYLSPRRTKFSHVSEYACDPC